MNDTIERAPTIEVREATGAEDWNAARALVKDLAAWVAERAGIDMRTAQHGFAQELAGLAETYRPPRGTLLLARVDDVAAGSVALKRHADGRGELKRMYVRPGARGLALGDQLVAGILAVGRRDGLRSVWLETAVGVMDPAIALYRRHGFTERPTLHPSVEHPGLITMERSLIDAGA